jgi:hypothetical protein
MTKVHLDGVWPDPADGERIRATLEVVIPDGQEWTISHAQGDEPVITYNPSRPLEPTRGRPLRKMRASTMANPPRYVYWNNAADDLRFTATTLLEMVLMVGIFNEVGVDRIRRDMTLFGSLPD